MKPSSHFPIHRTLLKWQAVLTIIIATMLGEGTNVMAQVRDKALVDIYEVYQLAHRQLGVPIVLELTAAREEEFNTVTPPFLDPERVAFLSDKILEAKSAGDVVGFFASAIGPKYQVEVVAGGAIWVREKDRRTLLHSTVKLPEARSYWMVEIFSQVSAHEELASFGVFFNKSEIMHLKVKLPAGELPLEKIISECMQQNPSKFFYGWEIRLCPRELPGRKYWDGTIRLLGE